jgi:hypothetical protein
MMEVSSFPSHRTGICSDSPGNEGVPGLFGKPDLFENLPGEFRDTG